MDSIKLQETLNILSKLTSITEERKQEILAKLSPKTEKEVIKELAKAAYQVFANNEATYNYSLEIIRKINPDICPPVEKMKELLSKEFANEIAGNMSMAENHTLINSELVRFTKLFNQFGIDYYIVGAIPCFIKSGEPLFRYHDDIDIMVNEKDIPKVAEIIAATGYKFQDDRFPSLQRFAQMQEKQPPHTVMAQNPDNEFHLGFFTFIRQPDSSIIVREYSHRQENGEVVTDVLERKSDLVGTSLRYDDKPTSYLGTTFKTNSIEEVYNIKEYTKRPKDITDNQKLKPYVDLKKLEMIRQHPTTNETKKAVISNDMNRVNYR